MIINEKDINDIIKPSVPKPEELQTPRIYINPPPSDRKCECCGKHISELKTFGKAGDPLVGDFDGSYLVKTFRRGMPNDKEAEEALNEAEENCTGSPLDYLITKYGKEKGEHLNFIGHGSSTFGASWECRDCIIFSDDQYFYKLAERGFF